MGDRRRSGRERRSTGAPEDAPQHAPQHPRWVRWLNHQPPAFYLLAAFVTAGLIGALLTWLDERTLALVACVAFAALLGWWISGVRRAWRDAELLERSIGVGGGVMLLGAAVANLVRFLASG